MAEGSPNNILPGTFTPHSMGPPNARRSPRGLWGGHQEESVEIGLNTGPHSPFSPQHNSPVAYSIYWGSMESLV